MTKERVKYPEANARFYLRVLSGRVSSCLHFTQWCTLKYQPCIKITVCSATSCHGNEK